MTGFWKALIGLTLASGLQAAPITDSYVKNLTLIGVIHVEGSKSRSVAVLRDRVTGRTRILHEGDSIAEANLQIRVMSPRQITLGRGEQTFVLRVENNPETSAALALPDQVETTEVELREEKESVAAVELPLPAESSSESSSKVETQVEQRRLIPDADCTNEECPQLSDELRNKD
jgi:hypothetical protein